MIYQDEEIVELEMDFDEHINVLTINGYKYYEIPHFVCFTCRSLTAAMVKENKQGIKKVFVYKDCDCKKQ